MSISDPNINDEDGPGESQLNIMWVLIVGSISLVVISVILLLGLSVVGGMADDMAEGDPENRTSTAAFTNDNGGLDDGLYRDGILFDTYVSFQATGFGIGSVTEVYEVEETNEKAVRFTGAGSSYQSDGDVDFPANDSWTVATWGEWNNSHSTTNGTLLDIDGRILIQYDNSTNEWIGWWYDEGARDSYRVNASTTNQPGTMEHVALVHNGTHLAIYLNNTQKDVVATDGGESDPLLDADNWAGDIEETRAYHEALSSSDRQQLVDDPILPVADANRSFRIMYDEGTGSSERVWFTGGVQLSFTDTEWVGGFNGTDLTEANDYDLDVASGDISPDDNGRLEGAPVAWVDYRFNPSDHISSISTSLAAAFELFGTAVLVIPAVAVLAALLGGLTVALRATGGFESPFKRRGGR